MKQILSALAIVITFFCIGYLFNREFYHIEGDILAHGLMLMQKNTLLILGINLCFYFFDTIRFFIIARILDLKISMKDAFFAIVLNVFFAWITPGAILGAPASTYYLYKKGHPLLESIVASAVRSFLIISTSILTTVVINANSTATSSDVSALQHRVYQVLIGIGIYFIFLVTLAILPKRVVEKYSFLNKISSSIRLFISKGWKYLIPLFTLTFTLNFLLVSFIFAVSTGYYTNLSTLFSQCMLFLSYILLMPTPGASGLAEVGAPMFFQGEIPVNFLTSATMAMRMSTFIVQILAGIVVLLVLFKKVNMIGEIKQFKEKELV